MGCRELDIRSQFYFVGAEEKSHSRKKTADYTQKTAYSRFSRTVISNYRYYSPELGRWLSRDPLYERGSTSWFKFNREDDIRKQIRKTDANLSALETLPLFKFVPTLKYMLSENLIKKKNFLEFILLQEMTGISLNVNPYAFVANNSINLIDLLGLDSPGADGVPDVLETPCVLECAAEHDRCFDVNDCTWCSWICPTSTACLICNVEVTACMAGCAAAGSYDDPNKPNYYCAQCHTFFDDPNSLHITEGHNTDGTPLTPAPQPHADTPLWGGSIM